MRRRNRATISRSNAQTVPTVEQPAGSRATLDSGWVRPSAAGYGYDAATSRPALPARLGQPPVHAADCLAAGAGHGTGGGQSPAAVPQLRPRPRIFFWTNYQALLSGSGGRMGRYGRRPLACRSAAPCRGSIGTGSPLTLNNAFPYNGVMDGSTITYWTNFQTIFDAYGSPPDPQTFGAVGPGSGRPSLVHFFGRTGRQRSLRHRSDAQRPARRGPGHGQQSLRRRRIRTHPPSFRSRRRHASAAIVQPQTSRQRHFHFAVAAGGIHRRKAGGSRCFRRAAARPAGILCRASGPCIPSISSRPRWASTGGNLNRHADAIAPLGNLARPEDGPQPALRGRGLLDGRPTGA